MKKVICWLLLLITMVGIFFFSAQTAEESDVTSGGVAENVLSIFYPSFDTLPQQVKQQMISGINSTIRTLAHFCVFALVGFFAFLALDNYQIKYKILYSQLISTGYAIFDEIHQYFVPGRSMQFFDVLVDSFGAICGILFCLLVKNIIKKIKSRKTA